jgi:predicted PurR-regulated permease PerM
MAPFHPPSGPGSRQRRIAFFSIASLVVVAVLFTFREVLAPFMVALVVAYVFAPVVDAMERIKVGGRKLPRWAAVLTLYIGLLASMAGTIAVGAPLLVREIQNLTREAPRMAATARDEWIPALDERLRGLTGALGESVTEIAEVPAPVAEANDTIAVVPREEGGYEVRLPDQGVLIEPTEDGGWVLRPRPEESGSENLSAQLGTALRHQLQEGAESAVAALRTVQGFISAVVGGIFRFFIMLMISAYILISAEQILRFFRTLVLVERRSMFDTLLRRIDRGLSGVVRGQLVICVVNGVLSGIGFYLIGLHYWPLLTVIATLLSIIPIFGAILSSVPAVIVGIQQGVDVALFTLAWIIGIHQIEANLLNPKIMGDAAKVHPVLVVFALIAGEHFFGILGALLAVPVLSIAQSLFLHFREVALGLPASATSPGVELPPRSGNAPRSGEPEPAEPKADRAETEASPAPSDTSAEPT